MLTVTMKTLMFLVLLGIHGAVAVLHSLQYFYTASTGMDQFPEFVAVGIVNGEQIDYYDSVSEKNVLKQTWMKGVRDESRTTEVRRGNQQAFGANIGVAMQRFNQTGGAHIVQWMYGCEWDDETSEVNGFNQYGYDGEDFVSLDLKTEEWVAPKQQAFLTKVKWDNNKAGISHRKNYLTQICPEWLKKYVNYGRSSLMRKDLPSVSLLQKTSSSPVTCHATGFYPDRADLVWMKDGEELHEDVDKGEILPNHDGTFQMSVDLKISSIAPEDWKKYDCVFQLSGVEDKITKLDKAVIKTNSANTVIIAITVAAAVVVMLGVLAVAGFVIYKKTNGVPTKEWETFSKGSDSSRESVNSDTPLIKDKKTSPDTSPTGTLKPEWETLSNGSDSSRESGNSDTPLVKDMKTSPDTSPTGTLRTESETLSNSLGSSTESVGSDTPLIKKGNEEEVNFTP